MSLDAGRVLQDKIRLVRVLGKGGMGSVWVAEHLGLRTQVAVKFMSAEIADNPEARGRFVREATAAAQIKSPHVVQVFDHGVTDDGFPFIVMELLEGEDLGKRIERLGALPTADVVEIVSQMCKALGRAHAQGIVHRDIKPENVFLVDTDDDELFIKVLDFGIAKRFADGGMNMTSTGAMVGTPYYMSPEQIMSAKDVDQRSDLWSVAVVAYHALTGALPFVAETVGALCVRINTAVFEPPSRLRPELGALDAWFAQALAREPAQRLASAKELADALRRAAGSALARESMELPPETVAVHSPALQRAESSGSWRSTEALSAHSAPAVSGVPRTLMEATISTSTPQPTKFPILGVVLGLAAIVGVTAVGLGVWWSTRGTAPTTTEPEAAAVTTVPTTEPTPPPPPPAPATSATATSPQTQPATPSTDKGAVATKGTTPATRATPTETRRAETKPAETKPAETKPATKPGEKDYGF